MAVFGLGRRAAQAETGENARLAGAPPFRANRVTKSYLKGSVIALDDVSFDVHANQVTAMIGPSGCGKTTMLRLMAGLEYPSRGDVTMLGQPILGPGPERGMVFQAYTSFPWLTTRANIEYGLKLQGLSRAERRETRRALPRARAPGGFADAYPTPRRGEGAAEPAAPLRERRNRCDMVRLQRRRMPTRSPRTSTPPMGVPVQPVASPHFSPRSWSARRCPAERAGKARSAMRCIGQATDALCRPDSDALRVAPRRPPASRVHARGAHDAGLNRIPRYAFRPASCGSNAWARRRP